VSLAIQDWLSQASPIQKCLQIKRSNSLHITKAIEFISMALYHVRSNAVRGICLNVSLAA
jgi:hypothetical protein